MTKVASHKSLLFALAISLVAGLTYVSGLSNPFAAEDFNIIRLSSLDFGALLGNLDPSPIAVIAFLPCRHEARVVAPVDLSLRDSVRRSTACQRKTLTCIAPL